MVATTIDVLIKSFYIGVTTGCAFMCLLITMLLLRDKGNQLLLYEKHKSILRFEALLLIIGFFTVLWFSMRIALTGGI